MMMMIFARRHGVCKGLSNCGYSFLPANSFHLIAHSESSNSRVFYVTSSRCTLRIGEGGIAVIKIAVNRGQ